MHAITRRTVLAVAAPLSGLSLLLLAACGDELASTGAASTTTTTATGPASSAVAPPSSASAGRAFAAACTPDELLAFVNTQANKPEGGYRRVEIYNCVAPYARIYAGPKEGMPDTAGEQFFLQYTGGTWTVLKTGLGVDCGDNAPETRAACAAFLAAALASESASAKPR
jgi:hypothetical protein